MLDLVELIYLLNFNILEEFGLKAAEILQFKLFAAFIFFMSLNQIFLNKN